jgi:hypothetical protein
VSPGPAADRLQYEGAALDSGSSSASASSPAPGNTAGLQHTAAGPVQGSPGAGPVAANNRSVPTPLVYAASGDSQPADPQTAPADSLPSSASSVLSPAPAPVAAPALRSAPQRGSATLGATAAANRLSSAAGRTSVPPTAPSSYDAAAPAAPLVDQVILDETTAAGDTAAAPAPVDVGAPAPPWAPLAPAPPVAPRVSAAPPSAPSSSSGALGSRQGGGGFAVWVAVWLLGSLLLVVVRVYLPRHRVPLSPSYAPLSPPG